MRRPINVALVAALVLATGVPDTNLATDLACGLPTVGDIPASGWWPHEISPKEEEITTLDHDQWHHELEAQVARAATRSGVALEEACQVWQKTLDEREKQCMNGPFTRDELDTAYGRGRWRAMQRFAVWQKGRLRACDNARSSLTNSCITRYEKMVVDSADFPARATAAFCDQFGAPVPMLSGNDDLPEAYRDAPTLQPEYTVVAVWQPAVALAAAAQSVAAPAPPITTGRVVYFTMPGFNFGITSAVPQFNRIPEGGIAFARRYFRVCAVHFFDDFNVTEPAWSARSGQCALRRLMREIGLPFAPDKAVDVSHMIVFLGVESDLSRVEQDGCVRMQVRKERVDALVQRCNELLDGGVLPTSVASSLCGKLQFTTSWCFGRFGRAAMQPLFRAASAKVGNRHRHNRKTFAAPKAAHDAPHEDAGAMSPGAAASLRFFASILPELPPYVFEVVRSEELPVLVWTDGKWDGQDDDADSDDDASDEGEGIEGNAADAQPLPQGAGVGFVVAIPNRGAEHDPSLQALARNYTIVHGSKSVPEEFMNDFVYRKQQIGQIEILGALAPYLSLPADVFAGKHVLHFIDNTSAAAALCKGYSRQPDSARLVHAAHATFAGLGCRVWFEYIRSKANVADAPSRLDLSSRRWDCGLSDAGIDSQPVPLVLPPRQDWSRDAAAWCRNARRRLEP